VTAGEAREHRLLQPDQPGADRSRLTEPRSADVAERAPDAEGPLLAVEGLVKHFPIRGGLPFRRSGRKVRAVDGISFEIQPRQTLSIVGESGCGKTTTSRLVLRLEDVTAGTISFEGRQIQDVRGQALRAYWNSVQAVMQDPWSSLNPRMRAGEIVGEPLLVNGRLRGKALDERVAELFAAVGLDPATAANYPHEFSGGQRQRLAIARALSLRPALIVLDEPVSALDVSIRAQIMNLLKDLQSEFGIAYLLIAHDLATVRYLSHDVAVMYLGEIVEYARGGELFENPLHPYTKALISAALPAQPEQDGDTILLSGEVPSPTNPPPGCRFHTRCPFAFERCSIESPAWRVVEGGHRVACHLY
jgi:oligopeptide/dipeptide ABC transporter ATP-binding protein